MKNFTFLLALLFSQQGISQLLTLQSADSLNGKPKKEFYTTAWLKYSGFVDFQGIPNESAMHLPSIPTDGTPPDPQFHADLYQTRLIFASRYQSRSMGEIKSYIETDFFGVGGKMRLRHAYIRFENLRIGQAWSGFTDEEAWPNITDFDGPSTGAWVRSAQIAYWFRLKENQDLMVSVEAPLADYSRYLAYDTLVQPALQTLPDLVSHYEIQWKTGHFQIAGVARFIEYKKLGKNEYNFGGGFSASGSQKFTDKGLLIWQAATGIGISRYLVSFGGGGWDAVPNTEGDLIPVPIYGGYVGYQIFWGGKNVQKTRKHSFSSTFVYGYTYLENPMNRPAPSLMSGSYASGNIYWHVVGPMNLAFEAIYGHRTDELGRTGDDLRLQFVAEYNF